MDVSNWFVWNIQVILFFSMIATFVWLICQTKEVKDNLKVKSPLLIGVVASLLGAVEIGLAAIVSTAIYLLFIYVLRYWYSYFKSKGLIGDLSQTTFSLDDKEEDKVSSSLVEPKVEIVDMPSPPVYEEKKLEADVVVKTKKINRKSE